MYPQVPTPSQQWLFTTHTPVRFYIERVTTRVTQNWLSFQSWFFLPHFFLILRLSFSAAVCMKLNKKCMFMSLVTRTKWQPSNIAIIEIEAPFLFTFLGSFFHSFAFSYSRITRCGVPSREMIFFLLPHSLYWISTKSECWKHIRRFHIQINILWILLTILMEVDHFCALLFHFLTRYGKLLTQSHIRACFPYFLFECRKMRRRKRIYKHFGAPSLTFKLVHLRQNRSHYVVLKCFSRHTCWGTTASSTWELLLLSSTHISVKVLLMTHTDVVYADCGWMCSMCGRDACS